MPIVYKNAQVSSSTSVTSYVNLFNTSASSVAVLSTIAVCNTATTNGTYRIAIVPASASASNPSASNWLVYDSVVAANDTVFLTVGAAIASSQFIRVSGSANTITFTGFISEST